MNTGTGRSRAHRTGPVAVLCLILGGCATGTPNGPTAMPNRLADASQICRDTMGLNPANAPHDLCVQSLLQNLTALDQPSLPVGEQTAKIELPGAVPESDTQKSCARFGFAPGSKSFETCAGNLGASLFEATDVAAR